MCLIIVIVTPTHQPNHVSFILMSLHHSTLTTFTTNNFWFFWYYPSPIRLVKYPQPIKRLDIIWIIPLWSLSPFMNPRCNRPPILRWILFNVVLFLSNTIAMITSAHKHFELSVRVCWIFFSVRLFRRYVKIWEVELEQVFKACLFFDYCFNIIVLSISAFFCSFFSFILWTLNLHHFQILYKICDNR